MEFFTQLLDIFVDSSVFHTNFFPQTFSQYFINLYLTGYINESITELNQNCTNLPNNEKKEVYLQLLLWMNTDKSYNSNYFSEVNKIMPLKTLIESDLSFQYQVFLMSMGNNKIFQKVLYCTNQWNNSIVIENNESSNSFQNAQLANMFDYLTVVILSGGKWNLIWFLDWMSFHNKLQHFKSNACSTYHIWFAIYYGKFQCAKILKNYGFQEQSNTNMRNMYPCINTMHQYDIIKFNNQDIYVKNKMYEFITIEEFKEKFNQIICPVYKRLLLGADDSFGGYMEEFIVNWNAEILFYMNYPKKIILNSIVELCADSNHLYCASLSKIDEHIKNTMKEHVIHLIYQMYINKKENAKKNYKKKLIGKKLASKIIFKRSDTYKTCGVCFEDFALDKKKVYCKLNCNHFFHADCIKEWRKYKNQCPYCRRDTNEVIKFNVNSNANFNSNLHDNNL